MRSLNVVLLAALLAATGPALADHGKGKHKKDKDQESAAEYAPGKDKGKQFSDKDADKLRGYYKSNPESRKQLPPGLAKKDKLPPGWQKKLAVGERVPDDVWAHRVPVPREIKLGDTPAGAINVRINDKIVRVAERTREVLDVLNLPSDIVRSSPPR
jgi:hypothetical protein